MMRHRPLAYCLWLGVVCLNISLTGIRRLEVLNVLGMCVSRIGFQYVLCLDHDVLKLLLSFLTAVSQRNTSPASIKRTESFPCMGELSKKLGCCTLHVSLQAIS